MSKVKFYCKECGELSEADSYEDIVKQKKVCSACRYKALRLRINKARNKLNSEKKYLKAKNDSLLCKNKKKEAFNIRLKLNETPIVGVDNDTE